jgi:hypothetical protein
VSYSLGRQCFAYLFTSCGSRSIPVDFVSFAAHKRHLALFAMANLLFRRMPHWHDRLYQDAQRFFRDTAG